MHDPLSIVLGVAGLLTVSVLWHLLTKKQGPRYHPGPSPLPFLGNVLQIPKETPWITYQEWAKQYGPAIHLKVPGKHILVLNSAKTVDEILNKRALKYADRPRLVMAGELVGFQRGLALLPYNDDAKLSRRFILQTIGQKALPDYVNLLDFETLRYLRGLRDSPQQFVKHLSYHSGAIILKIAYGYDVEPTNDPYVKLANDTLDKFSRVAALGWACDLFPFLAHLPAWLPGMKFKRLAAEWRKLSTQLFNKPYKMVKEQMRQGTAKASFTYTRLDETKSNWDDDHIIGSPAEIIKATATSLYAGASDTTVSALQSWFMAMTIHQDIQARALAEIQSVVGTDRLPTLADRPNLPYCEAIMKELVRWSSVGPLGIPHQSTEDDVYEGYEIKNGTIILANIWGVLHDAEEYPRPSVFDPTRFLGPNPQPDPIRIAFGFGRRACPGVHLAEATMFLIIAQTLALFSIQRELDNDGKEIIPQQIWETGTISRPRQFPCKIVPRSGKGLDLIQQL